MSEMGDRGQRTTRDSWGQLAPVSSPRPIPAPRKTWSASDWYRIERGHLPQHLEDKWFSYVEAQRLFLHRRWTGIGIYEVQFDTNGDRWRITEALITNDVNVWWGRGTDEQASVRLEMLIEGVLLGRSTGDYEMWRRELEDCSEA